MLIIVFFLFSEEYAYDQAKVIAHCFYFTAFSQFVILSDDRISIIILSKVIL